MLAHLFLFPYLTVTSPHPPASTFWHTHESEAIQGPLAKAKVNLIRLNMSIDLVSRGLTTNGINSKLAQLDHVRERAIHHSTTNNLANMGLMQILDVIPVLRKWRRQPWKPLYDLGMT